MHYKELMDGHLDRLDKCARPPLMDWFKDVLAVHCKLVPSRIGNFDRPSFALDVSTPRRLIREEMQELMDALDARDMVETVDGAIDLIYVVLGLLVTLGVDPRHIWNEIHASNMAKEGGEIRADGKFLKPPGWTPPDVLGWLVAQGYQDTPETRAEVAANWERVKAVQAMKAEFVAIVKGVACGTEDDPDPAAGEIKAIVAADLAPKIERIIVGGPMLTGAGDDSGEAD
jgi:hypothetical protein